jgi:large subunit ribosomal protein L15
MKFKKKKSTKQRASTFHGWGRGASHHKGAGNRGGRGRAGSGKKADGKKPSFWQEVQGRHGFTSKSRMDLKTINLEQVQQRLAEFEKSGVAVKKGTTYEVDLTRTDYDKLLGSGDVTTVSLIRVDFASKGAIASAQEAGAKVEVLKTIVKKEKKKAAPKKKAEEKDEA